MRDSMCCEDCIDWEQTGGEETNAIYEKSQKKREEKIGITEDISMVTELINVCCAAIERDEEDDCFLWKPDLNSAISIVLKNFAVPELNKIATRVKKA